MIPDWRIFGERRILTEADFNGTPSERQTRGLKPRHIDEEEFLFIARQTDDLFAPEMQMLGHAHWLNETIDHAMAALNRQLEAHVRTMQAAFGDRLDQFRLLLGKPKTEAICVPGGIPRGIHFTQAVRVVHVSQLDLAMRTFGEEHTVYEVKHP